jgi:hypothetical protein
MRDSLNRVVSVVKEVKEPMHNLSSAISRNNSILINHPHMQANTDQVSKYL